MSKIFPGTDLRAMPHINSKIHVWRKDYGSLTIMLKKSGIGWNDTTKMIEAEDEAWENFVKVDLNASLIRVMSNETENIMDLDFDKVFEDILDDIEKMPFCEMGSSINGTPKSRGKKRASLDCQDPLADMLGEFVMNTKTT
ncbi:hypothetical protein BUALT_Bualt12G0110500 [Buddleja alternifolia]|uniref:Myb/SANT-like domain-containing protein n=1 Tax=Buddleja alternifolia TaxID=168488 RepID=A0AAV6WXK8_9LAMI|nr:hypothetical protein BUALT_Bualt12G0110500 [Buddleja alternifolia]